MSAAFPAKFSKRGHKVPRIDSNDYDDGDDIKQGTLGTFFVLDRVGIKSLNLYCSLQKGSFLIGLVFLSSCLTELIHTGLRLAIELTHVNVAPRLNFGYYLFETYSMAIKAGISYNAASGAIRNDPRRLLRGSQLHLPLVLVEVAQVMILLGTPLQSSGGGPFGDLLHAWNKAILAGTLLRIPFKAYTALVLASYSRRLGCRPMSTFVDATDRTTNRIVNIYLRRDI